MGMMGRSFLKQDLPQNEMFKGSSYSQLYNTNNGNTSQYFQDVQMPSSIHLPSHRYSKINTARMNNDTARMLGESSNVKDFRRNPGSMRASNVDILKSSSQFNNTNVRRSQIDINPSNRAKRSVMGYQSDSKRMVMNQYKKMSIIQGGEYSLLSGRSFVYPNENVLKKALRKNYFNCPFPVFPKPGYCPVHTQQRFNTKMSISRGLPQKLLSKKNHIRTSTFENLTSRILSQEANARPHLGLSSIPHWDIGLKYIHCHTQL